MIIILITVTFKYKSVLLLYMYINTNQNESIKKYVLSLVENKRDLLDEQVGPNVDNTLLVIARNPGLSINKYCEYLNKDNNQKRNLGYVNVYTRIKKLENLRLIKKEVAVVNVDSKTDTNREFYYSVSTLGLYYIFMKNLISSDIDIILKNRDDNLFKIFLYPYIEINTLEHLGSKDIVSAIFKYLVNCTKIIDSVVVDHLIKAEKNSGDIQMVGFPNSSICPEDNEDMWSYGPKFSIDYLRNRYDIQWLDENNIKVIDEVIEDKKIIRITNEKGKEELIVELHPETQNAILLDTKTNSEIAEFGIDKHIDYENGYVLLDFIPLTLNQYLDHLFNNKSFYFYYDIENSLHELCFTILQAIRYDPYATADMFCEIQRNCEIIVKDVKFRKLAEQSRGISEKTYYHELDIHPIPRTNLL
jgi:hypothetical protein